MLCPHLGSVVLELKTGDYLVRRGAVPVNDGFGRLTPGVPVEVGPLPMSVQPLQGESVEKLPEGERTDDWREVYATVALNPVSVSAGRTADVLVVDGEDFEVQSAHDWVASAGFCRAMVKRVPR